MAALNYLTTISQRSVRKVSVHEHLMIYLIDGSTRCMQIYNACHSLYVDTIGPSVASSIVDFGRNDLVVLTKLSNFIIHAVGIPDTYSRTGNTAGGCCT
ncbi:hypothetical protein [Nonlabens sp.]|jgi:hypothetical protein|uniref:hypothetical protein n=2 Tax=Nonlabens sp. TaxID=1888209 RepID=UPI0039E695AC